MNHEKTRDIWIGVFAVVIIASIGVWWLAADGGGSLSLNTMATSTSATTTVTTTTTSYQKPQAVSRTSQTVVTIAENLSGAGTFASLLNSTGVAAQLKGPGPYTIFVPTDAAIDELPKGTISGLSAAGKKRLVEYHIVSGRAVDVTAEFAGSIQALSGDALNFSFNTTKIPMVNSAILITQYKASNGVVYLIDNVLIPPKSTQQF